MGVDLFKGCEHCPFCRSVMDPRGHHCGACMAGGDVVLRHNELRNTVHAEASKAGMHPELESQGLLANLGWVDMVGRRPADTLLVSPTGLAVTSRRRFPKVALDFAVVSPFSVSALPSATEQQLATAEAYADRKRRHNNTEYACGEADLGFEPIVFEAAGGLEPGGAKVLESLLKEVARSSGQPW